MKTKGRKEGNRLVTGMHRDAHTSNKTKRPADAVQAPRATDGPVLIERQKKGVMEEVGLSDNPHLQQINKMDRRKVVLMLSL